MKKFIPHFLVLLPFCLLTLFLAGCSADGGGDGKITLKMALPENKQFLFTTDVHQEITTSGMSMKQHMVFDLKYEMLPREAGQQKLKVTYDHIQMTASSAMGELSFDSNDTLSDSPLQAMRTLIGHSFMVYFDESGGFQKVEGVNSLMDSLQVRTSFNDSAMASMMKSSFDFYPSKPIAVGESWKTQSATAMANFTMNVSNTYTLKAVENDIATVTVVSKLSMPESTMNERGMAMKVKMQGEQTGAMEVAIPTGLILSGKMEQQINGNMEAGGQQIPMSVHSTVQMSSKEL